MSEKFKPGEGDWVCADTKCGNINFARRNKCNRCGHEKEEGIEIKKQGTEIGKMMAEKSHGLFSADDWQCKTCGNVNWARRNQCNVCNAPKYAKTEKRTGYGGGFMERDVVIEYKDRHESDDEFDEFGIKKKKFRGSLLEKKDQDAEQKMEKDKIEDEEKKEVNFDDEEEEEDDDEDFDESKYNLDDEDLPVIKPLIKRQMADSLSNDSVEKKNEKVEVNLDKIEVNLDKIEVNKDTKINVRNFKNVETIVSENKYELNTSNLDEKEMRKDNRSRSRSGEKSIFNDGGKNDYRDDTNIDKKGKKDTKINDIKNRNDRRSDSREMNDRQRDSRDVSKEKRRDEKKKSDRRKESSSRDGRKEGDRRNERKEGWRGDKRRHSHSSRSSSSSGSPVRNLSGRDRERSFSPHPKSFKRSKSGSKNSRGRRSKHQSPSPHRRR